MSLRSFSVIKHFFRWLRGWVRFSRRRAAHIRSLAKQLNQLQQHVANAKRSIYRIRRKYQGANFACDEPISLFRYAKEDERLAVGFVLRVKSSEPGKLEGALLGAGTHSILMAYRWLKSKEPCNRYVDIARKVAKHLNVKADQSWGISKLEEAIVVAQFSDVLSKLDPVKRKEIEAQIKREEEKLTEKYRSLIGGGGAILAAQASGFGVYMMASTIVGAASSAIGITLPFAFYTGMSQVIAVAIGPIGWAALVAGFVYKVGAPRMDKIVPAVFLVATIRSRLLEEQRLALLAANRTENEILPKLHSAISQKARQIRYFKSLSYADERLEAML